MKTVKFTKEFIEECTLQAIDLKLLGYRLFCIANPSHGGLRTTIKIVAVKVVLDEGSITSFKEIAAFDIKYNVNRDLYPYDTTLEIRPKDILDIVRKYTKTAWYDYEKDEWRERENTD